MRIIFSILLCVGLVGCGGDKPAETNAVSSELSTSELSKAAAKPSNNPLAAEQQLIRDAEALQGILNKDADRKKQAVKDAN